MPPPRGPARLDLFVTDASEVNVQIGKSIRVIYVEPVVSCMPTRSTTESVEAAKREVARADKPRKTLARGS
jgi:hypothetical protein